MTGDTYPFDQFPLSPIVPEIDNWPITQFSRDKEQVIEEVINLTIRKLEGSIESPERLHEVLAKVLYQERIRLTQKPWLADKPDEKEFWSNVKQTLLKEEPNGQSDAPFALGQNKVLRDILKRYTEEIVGNFDPGTYNFARKSVPFVLRKLLNAAPSNRMRFWSNKKTLTQKIKTTGPLDKIRALGKQGTVIVVPTHFSNLDSLVIGWAIDNIGLPPFIYGAGLNLFGIKLFAYFMNRLGAYRVDRRKKNLLYLDLLKNFSSVAIQRGVHSLFFPGGTRSRSGALEDKLKLGLLGTAVEAQRLNFQEGNQKKIFIVPAVINYHFVLEAPVLINEHLKRTGKERYLAENDEYSTSYKIAKFILKFLNAGSDITVSFAEPMDVVGNTVNERGESINHLGDVVDLKDYFKISGALNEDKQRENEYTRMLAKTIVDRFHKYNTVLTSHMLAYTAFETLKQQHDKLDLYAFLRLPQEDSHISEELFHRNLEGILTQLKALRDKGEVQLSPELDRPLQEIIAHGLKNLGMFHAASPLKRKGSDYLSEDLKVLYYYRNRLDGFNLKVSG